MSERTSTSSADRRKRPRVDERAQSALRGLIRIENLIRRLAEPHFAQWGISSAQWGVLRSLTRLSESGNSRPLMRELGAALIVQPPSLSAMLDRMEHAGLVVRHQDPSDHRTRRITLTPAGKSLIERALPTHRAWAKRAMTGLTTKEQGTFCLLIQKLVAHLDEQVRHPKAANPANAGRDTAQRRHL